MVDIGKYYTQKEFRSDNSGAFSNKVENIDFWLFDLKNMIKRILI